MTDRPKLDPTRRAPRARRGCGTRCGLRRRTILLLGVMLACAGPAAAPNGATADAAAPSEYEVKAALLLNFAKFVRWPDSAFGSADAPFVIGVLGTDPYGALLERTCAGETIDGRSIAVRRADQVEDLLGSHMLVVAPSERDRVAQVLSAVGDRSIATVGEVPDFALRGGVFNFYIDDGKVRFEVNAAAAERKGLRISSQLLRRARIIGPVPRREAN